MRITDSTVNLTSARSHRTTMGFSMEKGTGAFGASGDILTNFREAMQRTELVTGGTGREKTERNVVDDEENRKVSKKGEEELFTNYNANGGFAVHGENGGYSRISEIESIRQQIMERLLNIMQRLYEGMSEGSGKNRMRDYMQGLSERMGTGGYQWMSVSTATYVYTEEETTAFSAQGVARTEDGRELNFGVSLNMTSTFKEAIGVAHIQPAALIDPLVINVSGSVTEITDQTFTFDLDADGKEDTVKGVSKGSGFLAYDRNGDGVINDGTELFGAVSGDGFTELSEFDSDGNGWIDESDDIYSKLRVWCRGEDGADTMMTLAEADVGAIFLGRAPTEFASRGSDFAVNGMFRASGFFLHESTGEAGMIQQVDLAKAAGG